MGRNNKKNRQRSLKLKLRNAGETRQVFARAIQNFALDLHTSGLYQKVILATDLRNETPEVRITLVPMRTGAAPIIDTPTGELHVEKLELRGHFNIHARSSKVPARALEMTVDDITLKGYLPDNNPGARGRVFTGMQTVMGRRVPTYKTATLPKEQRGASRIAGIDAFTVSVYDFTAAAFLSGHLAQKGLLPAHASNTVPADAPRERQLPRTAIHAINSAQGARRRRERTETRPARHARHG